MRVGYLTGQHVYLRPPEEEDKERATAWFASVFPIDASRATLFLEDHPFPWWAATEFTLIIARLDDDQVVGSLRVSSSNHRTASVRVHMAPALPEADALRAGALRIVIPWLRDEHEYMVVQLFIPGNASETIGAAEALGMVQSVRLREFIAVPGGRVDELVYEALNPRWEVHHA